jgi:hypothetical protein
VQAITLRNASALNAEEGHQDLVFMHMPYNFGHSIEKVALFPPETSRDYTSKFIHYILGGYGSSTEKDDAAEQTLASMIEQRAKPGGRVWGHFHPALQQISNVTGCALYFTPQKYWPEDVARRYFGDQKVFGLLRNPYERVVAMFRGARMLKAGGDDYGTDFNASYIDSCDVNSAIKEMMNNYIESGNQFESSCAYLPQAEYFDGPYGITVPIDNMRFPESMNEAYLEHGYDDHIRKQDIFHVYGCPEVWSADLDEDTKALVRRVYARDFELICTHFGQCDDRMDDCIRGVSWMCPKVACEGEQVCTRRETLAEVFGLPRGDEYLLDQRIRDAPDIATAVRIALAMGGKQP